MDFKRRAARGFTKGMPEPGNRLELALETVWRHDGDGIMSKGRGLPEPEGGVCPSKPPSRIHRLFDRLPRNMESPPVSGEPFNQPRPVWQAPFP